MTIQQLKYALALQKHGNYSKAAKSVGISQPAMSLQIKNLENDIGIALFDRSSKRIEPTYEGKLFLDRAQELVNRSIQLMDFALQLNDEFTGEIFIGIIPTLAPYLLPLFLNELHASYPKLKVHIKEAITEEIIDDIRSSRLHGGIISTPIQTDSHIQSYPIFYEKFLLFVSDKHELFSKEDIQITEIPMKDLWLLREGNCFRDQINNICEIEKINSAKSIFYYESNSIEALCRVVEHKAGITFLPELTSLHFGEDRENMIKKIADQQYIREISMIYLSGVARKTTLDRISEVIQHNIPQYMLDPGNLKPLPTNVFVS